jgi:Viral BACON domain
MNHLAMTAAVLFLPVTMAADTLHVPGEYSRIQDAIDAAVHGDIVEIADGTYSGFGNRSLNTHGKHITVRSASRDPTRCRVDCQFLTTGFYFAPFDNSTATIEGLTVMHGIGRNGRGGAVYCDIGSRPTFVNCAIVNNAVDDGGAGVYCSRSYPTFINCDIGGNLANSYGAFGAGLSLYQSTAVLLGCRLVHNVAGGTTGVGGGLGVHSSTVFLDDCVFLENAAMDEGGAISITATSTLVVTNGEFAGNRTAGMGGALHIDSNGAIFQNTLLVGNRSGRRGGAVYCEGGSPTFTNCTFVDNEARIEAGTLYCTEGGSPELTNCILWGGDPQEVITDDGAPVITYSDVQGGWDGEGNISTEPHFALANDFRLLAGSPCIDAGTNEPPGGLQAEDREGVSRTLDGNQDGAATADMGAYEFAPGAARTGVNTRVCELTRRGDTTGSVLQSLQIRNAGAGSLNWEVQSESNWLSFSPTSGVSDGETDTVTLTALADDLPPGQHVGMVEISADGAANPTCELQVILNVGRTRLVPDEYNTIQSAVDVSWDGDVVLIADGTYTGDGNKKVGFRSKAITVRSVSGDPENCVIDCGGFGSGFVLNDFERQSSVLQGFTMTNGNTSGLSIGGGNPTIIDCRIVNNRALSGGGLYIEQGAPLLIGCEISGNRADRVTSSPGGGVYCKEADATFIECRIASNRASSRGGGVAVDDWPLEPVSQMRFLRCEITDNESDHEDGGGVHCGAAGAVALIDSVIAGNEARNDGGGLSVKGGQLLAINTTIAGNEADRGGGAFCQRGSVTALQNCEMVANAATQEGGGLYCFGNEEPLSLSAIGCTFVGNLAPAGSLVGLDSEDQSFPSAPEFENCILQGTGHLVFSGDQSMPIIRYCNAIGASNEPWFGAGCIDADPLFVDPDGPDDDPLTWHDNDYQLSPGSPCIDAGDNTAVSTDEFDLDGDGDTTEPIPFDLDGNPRFIDDPDTVDTGNGTPPIVDMGAYEFQVDQACPGDVDGDGDTDQSDLGLLLAAYEVDDNGDLDGDGDTDQSDLGILLADYECGT